MFGDSELWVQTDPLPKFEKSSNEPGYNLTVEKAIRIFSSFDEADEADARAHASMSPEERLQLVIELSDRRHPDAANQGLARVCKVIERERS
jgi:hypothetical protein